jgi:hypothetical protein
VQADGKEDHQDDDSTGNAVSTITRGSSKIGWSALQIEWNESLYTDNQDAMSRMKNCILLDSGSTLSLFSNPELVKNIRTTGRTLALATNADVKHSNKEATVPGFGMVYYDEDAIANVFGLSYLKKNHRVTYDSNKEDAFLVHMNDKIIKFECSPDGLYEYKVSEDYQSNLQRDEEKEGTSNLVTTVTENKSGYTQRQFKPAKEARRLYHIVDTPTVENFKSLL